MNAKDRIKTIIVAFGTLGISSLSAWCDNPNDVHLATQGAAGQSVCSCLGDNGFYHKGEIKSGADGLTVGVQGWRVDAGGCQGVGQPCPWVQYGSTVYSTSYVVPRGKCYTGTITWRLVAVGTLP